MSDDSIENDKSQDAIAKRVFGGNKPAPQAEVKPRVINAEPCRQIPEGPLLSLS